MKDFFRGKMDVDPRYISQSRGKAMRGQIERALVELITNSDDSYCRLEERNIPTSGSILIEIKRRKKGTQPITVRDRAEGMSPQEMKEKLGVLGEEGSGFEQGKQVRGLLGRGAKDIAEFGRVRFESIKDDTYAECVLEPSTDINISYDKVTKTHRDSLGIPHGNGTVVTLEVEETFPVPLHQSLLEEFASYYSLRDIFCDTKRKVRLVDLNQKRNHPLSYRYPNGETLLSEEISIPSYPGATASLLVKRHQDRFVEDKRGSHASYRQGGLLIKSEHAIHEVTLFGYENEPYAEFFFGEVKSPYIDTLIREYEERYRKNQNNPQHPPNNPMRLLDVDRDGLIKEHPFTKALTTVVMSNLKTLVEAERDRDRAAQARIEDKITTKRLKHLAKAVSKYLERKARELEEIPTPGSGESRSQIPEGLIIIPGGEWKIKLGEKMTFTIKARINNHETEPENIMVIIHSDNEGIQVSETDIRLLKADPKLPVAQGNFRVWGMKLGAEGLITATLHDSHDRVRVEVVEAKGDDDIAPPDGLTFDKPRYNIVLGKPKHLELRANLPDYKDDEMLVQLLSTNPEDILIRRPTVSLRKPPGKNYHIGTAIAEGRRLGAMGIIRAVLSNHTTEANVRVVQRDEPSGFPVDIEIKNEDYGTQRAVWEGDLLKISGKHKSVSRYLGKPPKFEGQHSPHFRLLLAELVADNVCRRLLEERDKKEREKYGQIDMDAPAFYVEHYRLINEFVAIAHEVLLTRLELEKLHRDFGADESGQTAS